MGTTIAPGIELHLDPALQQEAEQICADTGQTLQGLFTRVVKRMVRDGHPPAYLFEPNQETIDAMEAARRGEVTRVNSFEELIASLDAED